MQTSHFSNRFLPALLAAVAPVAFFLPASEAESEPPYPPLETGDSPSSDKRFALRGSYFFQEADLQLAALDLGFPDIEALGASAPPEVLAMLPTLGPGLVESIEQRSHTASLALEAELLGGFLELGGRVGQVDASSDIEFAVPFEDQSTTFHFDGQLYGVGAEITFPLPYLHRKDGAGDYLGLHAAAGGEWIYVDLDTGSTEIWIARPRVLWLGKTATNRKYQFWVGANWVDTTLRQSGDFKLPGLGRQDFSSVAIDSVHWNYVAGGQIDLTDRWSLSAEVGFGERKHALVGFGLRF